MPTMCLVPCMWYRFLLLLQQIPHTFWLTAINIHCLSVIGHKYWGQNADRLCIPSGVSRGQSISPCFPDSREHLDSITPGLLLHFQTSSVPPLYLSPVSSFSLFFYIYLIALHSVFKSLRYLWIYMYIYSQI
jgi:hypothetical protein